MSSSNSLCHSLYQNSLSKRLKKWLKRRSRRLDPLQLEAALILMRLDLDPVRDELAKLYSCSPRGRPPFDPLCMLRALLLMTLLGYLKIDQFASDLRRLPRLAHLAGFTPHKTPSVGAFYLFIDRIEDGHFQPSCPHRIKPSKLGKGRHRRNLFQEKQEKEARRKQILKDCDSITAHLKDQLLASSSLPRPRDFLSRLEDLLIKVAVKPSARRGLLGELSRVILSGDGSALRTGASSVGKPACNCRKEGKYNCKCDRFYSDATADWGYDSYRECYYFGHTFYQHVVSSNGHDLPLHVSIGPASESDFTLSLKSLDRLQKSLKENCLDLKIEAVAYDAGHDATGIYEYLIENFIKAVIALNQRSGQPAATGTAQIITLQGAPICPAGLEMRRHAKTKNGRIYYNCPVKRPTHIFGKTEWKTHLDACPRGVLCQPETKMGPVVYVRSDEDVRLYPEIARSSALYKKIMNQRTGCERSNSTKKVTYKLGQRVCRNASHYLIRLYLVSLIEHARAWLSEDRKMYGSEIASLIDIEKMKLAAPT